MSIHQPGRRLMHAVPLKFVQKKVSGGGHRPTSANLSLTSMIDFLVVTVVFLLITFSASGETPVSKGIKLPDAENTLDMIDAPMVGITGSLILEQMFEDRLTMDGKSSSERPRDDESFGRPEKSINIKSR